MTKGKFPLFSQIFILVLIVGYFIFAEFSPSAASASNDSGLATQQNQQKQGPPRIQAPPRIMPPPRISPGPPPHPRPVSWTDSGIVFQPYFEPSLNVTVSENAGHIEWDCAHADLETAVADGFGGFVATGTYTVEHMGPTRPGDDDSTRALFVGVVKGGQLTLNITTYLKSNSQTTLNLNQNNNRRPFKCK